MENKYEIARDSLNEIENWRCKIKRESPLKFKFVKRKTSENEKVTKREKPNYLTPCADWDLIPHNKVVGVPI